MLRAMKHEIFFIVLGVVRDRAEHTDGILRINA
jgi:hypothetical protein